MSETKLNEIRLMLLLNFIELQDIRRRLDISPEPSDDPDSYIYPNSLDGWIKEHKKRMKALIRHRVDYPEDR